jgi:hypothetical protein
MAIKQYAPERARDYDISFYTARVWAYPTPYAAKGQA